MRLPDRLRGVRLTGRGIAFLVAALVGLITAYASGWPALLAAALFLAAAVAAALVTVLLSPPAVGIERRVDPPVVEQGMAARVRLTVRAPAASAFEWAETVPRGLVARGEVAGSATGGGPRLVEYAVVGRRRGAYRLGPFGVVRADPLGLAATRRRIGDVEVLTVLPRLREVEVPAVVTRTDPDSAASTAFGPVGDQRDVVAREYRAGDPMRSVDWRATARRGELMVRTEAAAAASSTALALETRTEAWRDAGEFEWAVEYTASVAAVLHERGSTVRFAADGRTPVAQDATAALVALAVVDRRTGAPRAPELAARLAARDVRVLHLVTGLGSAVDLPRLPVLPHGMSGIVTVVCPRGGADELRVPAGWRLEAVEAGGRRG